MKTTSERVALSSQSRMIRDLSRKITGGHAVDWPQSVVTAWTRHWNELETVREAISEWIEVSDSIPFQRFLGLEWLVCGVPSSRLVRVHLEEIHGQKPHRVRILEWLEWLDNRISMLDVPGQWIRAPISNEVLRNRSGSGATPLGMIAARMGRPGMLVGAGLSMSLEERKKMILAAANIDLYQDAISIFSEAEPAHIPLLNDTVWGCLAMDYKGLALPLTDPPALWWDRRIRFSPGPEYPDGLVSLVEQRPHLSRDLAAAMLRSGIEQVEALSHAQPGLAATSSWPAMDGNPLPAMGVVVDSWIESLRGKIPGPKEKIDLKKKRCLVLNSLPEDISRQPSAQRWSLIARMIVGDGDDKDLLAHARAPEKMTHAVMNEWQEGSYMNTPSSWKRWAEIVSYSFWGASPTMPDRGRVMLEHLLPFVRHFCIDLHVSAPDRASQQKAEEAMRHLLLMPERLNCPESEDWGLKVEWSFWLLYCERSMATNGWKKSKEITSGPARILRQIHRSMGEGPSLAWDLSAAKSMQSMLSMDAALPGWALSFLETEVLRLSNESASSAPTRARGRL